MSAVKIHLGISLSNPYPSARVQNKSQRIYIKRTTRISIPYESRTEVIGSITPSLLIVFFFCSYFLAPVRIYGLFELKSGTYLPRIIIVIIEHHGFPCFVVRLRSAHNKDWKIDVLRIIYYYTIWHRVYARTKKKKKEVMKRAITQTCVYYTYFTLGMYVLYNIRPRQSFTNR